MKFELTKAQFDTGIYHTIPTLAIIYDHNTRGVGVDVAFLKWCAAVHVSYPRKVKSASKKGKK